MTSYTQRLLEKVSELVVSTVGNMVRPGVVEQVKGDKVRLWLGNDREGNKVLSPWLHTGNMRGGARERRYYKKGQNMMMLSPAGDWRQAVLFPYAPNKDHLSPDHSNKSGLYEETYQQAYTRERITGNSQETWLSDQSGEDEQQQTGQLEKLPEQRQNKGDDPEQSYVYIRMGDKPEEEQNQQSTTDQSQQQKKTKQPSGKYYIRAKESIIFEVGGATVTIKADSIVAKLGNSTHTIKSDQITSKVGNGEVLVKNDHAHLKVGDNVRWVSTQGTYDNPEVVIAPDES